VTNLEIKNFARKLVEQRPDPSALRRMVRPRKPLSLLFADDGIVPNNLRYRGAVDFRSVLDPATVSPPNRRAPREKFDWLNSTVSCAGREDAHSEIGSPLLLRATLRT
jgi:hypothetical protein